MKSLDATMNGMPFIVFIQIVDPVIQNKFRIPYSICITPYRSAKLGLSAQIISQSSTVLPSYRKQSSLAIVKPGVPVRLHDTSDE